MGRSTLTDWAWNRGIRLERSPPSSSVIAQFSGGEPALTSNRQDSLDHR
jgi:hypothetical protein